MTKIQLVTFTWSDLFLKSFQAKEKRVADNIAEWEFVRSDPDKIVPGYDRLVQCGDACTGENYPVPRYVQTITRTPNARRKRRDGKFSVKNWTKNFLSKRHPKFFRFDSTTFTDNILDIRVLFSVANFVFLRAIEKNSFKKCFEKKRLEKMSNKKFSKNEQIF